MKAAPFEYCAPTSLAEALALMNDPALDILPLSGGQSLMPMMNFRVTEPQVLMDLAGLEGLKKITQGEDGCDIGARVTYAELEKSQVILNEYPLIAAMIPKIAHSAIRNRGTVGGSVALADPAAELPAALMALDGAVHVQSAQGSRRLSARDYFQGPYETLRHENELVTGIALDGSMSRRRFGLYEVTRRHGDYALAGAIVTSSDAGGTYSNTRVVIFAALDKPTLILDAQAALEDRPLGDAAAINAAVEALEAYPFDADTMHDAHTRKTFAKVALKRALGGLT